MGLWGVCVGVKQSVGGVEFGTTDGPDCEPAHYWQNQLIRSIEEIYHVLNLCVSLLASLIFRAGHAPKKYNLQQTQLRAYLTT